MKVKVGAPEGDVSYVANEEVVEAHTLGGARRPVGRSVHQSVCRMVGNQLFVRPTMSDERRVYGLVNDA